MRLSQKVKYGVGCLFELSKRPAEYVHTEEIARRQGIPASFAHKVLQRLAQSGYVLGQKGAGYKIARALDDITAAELIDALTSEPAADAVRRERDPGSAFESRINRALGLVNLGQILAE